MEDGKHVFPESTLRRNSFNEQKMSIYKRKTGDYSF